MGSELTQTMNQSLSLAWDGIAGSDVSSELTSSYEQLLEGILVAMGGATLDDLYYDDTEIIEAILNQADAGNTLTALSTSRVELWAAIVNALGGSGSHLLHSEDELVAMFATLVEDGLPGGDGALVASRYINSNTHRAHTLAVGVVGLSASLYNGAADDTFYSHAITGAGSISGSLYTNTSTFYTHTLTNSGIFLQADFSNPNNQPWVFW